VDTNHYIESAFIYQQGEVSDGLGEKKKKGEVKM